MTWSSKNPNITWVIDSYLICGVFVAGNASTIIKYPLEMFALDFGGSNHFNTGQIWDQMVDGDSTAQMFQSGKCRGRVQM